MTKFNYKSNILLLLAAVIWGVAFVAQDIASKMLESFAINGCRCIIAFLFLLIIIIIKSKKQKTKLLGETKKDVKTLLIAGISCGICLFFAMNFQQFGIASYPENVPISGRAGFITGLYVVIVAIISVFTNKKLNVNIIISVVLSMIGLYLLCFSKGIKHLYIGDLIIFICAIAFALQIICVDKYISLLDGIKLSAMQLLVCGILSFVLMFIFEKPTIKQIYDAKFPLLYLGIFSSGIAYTFQILGQKYSNNPTVDSIIMSLETVFALIGGVIILKDKIEIQELIGCIIMFSAIILSQIPFKKNKKQVLPNNR